MNYLVGTASADLSAEIVVGTSPGGVLGGTWASPTLDNNVITNAHMADDAIGVAELSASGTASSATFLRGDNSWAAAGVSENDVIIMTEAMMYS